MNRTTNKLAVFKTVMNNAIEMHAICESAYEQKFETRQVVEMEKGALLQRLK